jgi:hypothetical protein
LVNFEEAKKVLLINKHFFLEREIISYSLHFSKPEAKIDLSLFPFCKQLKSLSLFFNGFPELENYNFFKGKAVNVFTINFNLRGFERFWKELPEAVTFKTMNLYIHLNSYSEFEGLFIKDNELLLLICEKIYSMTRSHALSGINLNVILPIENETEELLIKNLKLRHLIFNDRKYYLGFLDLFSVNLIMNADSTFFIYSGFDTPFIQLPKYIEDDKSLEMSLKLSKFNGESILLALKKKNLGKFVMKNVFKFLATKEFTIVSFSKICYKTE